MQAEFGEGSSRVLRDFVHDGHINLARIGRSELVLEDFRQSGRAVDRLAVGANDARGGGELAWLGPVDEVPDPLRSGG